MKNILITSYDMEIGGVERSLINMLSEFNYKDNNVDLMLYSHTGDFFEMLPDKHNLLKEIPEYKTFRQGISTIIKKKFWKIGVGRIRAKIKANKLKMLKKYNDIGYVQMQYMWKYSLNNLPNLDKEYDVAISYLWPHHFVGKKVIAKKKIAWIHTDYSIIETDIEEDLKVWNEFDHICAVSKECKNSFLKKYPILEDKVKVIENITSPEFIKKLSNQKVNDYYIDRKEEFNLLSVARFSHAKGIDNAIRALKILHDRGLKNIKWSVVGYGGDEELIRNLIREKNLEDSFIILGKKINPYPYMKLCDLYVQPSRYEGKAVTVGEAQILNKPVLITDYPTSKSQVIHGVNGYITEMGPNGIANGIEKLYKNEKIIKSLSENCKKQCYDNSVELEKLYELF